MSRTSRFPPSRSRRGLAALIVMVAVFLLSAAPRGALAQAPEPGAARPGVAVLPFAVSGALEYESVGPFVPDMLASRMSEMGSYRFIDTVEMRKENGGSPSGTLAPEDAARLASRFGADYVIAGAIRRSGGVTVMSAQVYARDGSDAGDRVVVPVVTLEDLLPKMEPLAEALATRLRPSQAVGEGVNP